MKLELGWPFGLTATSSDPKKTVECRWENSSASTLWECTWHFWFVSHPIKHAKHWGILTTRLPGGVIFLSPLRRHCSGSSRTIQAIMLESSYRALPQITNNLWRTLQNLQKQTIHAYNIIQLDIRFQLDSCTFGCTGGLVLALALRITGAEVPELRCHAALLLGEAFSAKNVISLEHFGDFWSHLW